MEMVAGYVAAGLIGISLGLIGGGGSIISIPVLVYLFRIDPFLATTYSLFIVGVTSIVGGIQSSVHHEASLRKAILFSIPSVVSVFITRHYLLTHLPENIALGQRLLVSKNMLVMVLFSVVMIVTSIGMIRNGGTSQTETTVIGKTWVLILAGCLVGILTGFIGAGGGFLIIPMFVLVNRMPIKKAVGTSLIVIAINSLVGFFSNLNLVRQIDFQLMLLITGIALAGLLLGQVMSHYIAEKKLKAGFGWFSLTTAVFVFVKEVLF